MAQAAGSAGGQGNQPAVIASTEQTITIDGDTHAHPLLVQQWTDDTKLWPSITKVNGGPRKHAAPKADPKGQAFCKQRRTRRPHQKVTLWRALQYSWHPSPQHIDDDEKGDPATFSGTSKCPEATSDTSLREGCLPVTEVQRKAAEQSGATSGRLRDYSRKTSVQPQLRKAAWK
ncbi:hypothetical protein V5799_003512 [Amblyomma americanum]|uniref:Uncharacterized protein n=1 Tax=Amblyomma americanum TaxID=6943 RepID=A0AAQ4D8R5_AMBAM